MTKRTIVFEIEKLNTGRWYIASSKDLRGVFAQGDSEEQVRRRLPRVLRTFFEAQGLQVESIRTQPIQPVSRSAGGTRIVRAEAHFETA